MEKKAFLFLVIFILKVRSQAHIIQDSGPSITVKLKSTLESTLPPMISAVGQVYTASDTTTTAQDDLDGLAVLQRAFDLLSLSIGDPCTPSYMKWDWVGCTGTDPPRVTSLYLSDCLLDGHLPDFSQMTALRTIDMSDNFLNGPIPDFLGIFPDLTLLNLENNDFSGSIPQSIVSNKKLKYLVDGNPNLDTHPESKKNTALIVGLSVGIPAAMILVIAALLSFLIYKRKTANTQRTAQGPGGTPTVNGGGAHDTNQANATPNVSMVTLTVPSSEQNNYQTQSNTPGPGGEGFPVYATYPSHGGDHVAEMESANHENQASMVPDMDVEELDELLRQNEVPHEPKTTSNGLLVTDMSVFV